MSEPRAKHKKINVIVLFDSTAEGLTEGLLVLYLCLSLLFSRDNFHSSSSICVSLKWGSL